jgi:hypothetical protein
MSFKEISQQVVDLCTEVFGQEVSYTPSGGSATDIKGVFDNAYIEVEGVVSLRPILKIKLSDLDDAPARGDAVEIDSVEYTVSESRLDGHGGSLLILKKG